MIREFFFKNLKRNFRQKKENLPKTSFSKHLPGIYIKSLIFYFIFRLLLWKKKSEWKKTKKKIVRENWALGQSKDKSVSPRSGNVYHQFVVFFSISTSLSPFSLDSENLEEKYFFLENFFFLVQLCLFLQKVVKSFLSVIKWKLRYILTSIKLALVNTF